MKTRNLRRIERMAFLILAAGVCFQTASCSQTGGIAVVQQQAANLLTDALFFLLDTSLVRLRG